MFDPSYAQLVIDRLCSNRLAKTPEGISIWLSVHSSFPTVKLPRGIWHGEDPLHVKEKAVLAKVLKEASESKELQDGGERSRQKGMWNSKLHFTWDVVLATFFERQTQPGWGLSKPPKRLNFVEFWMEVIDSEYWISDLFDYLICNR